MIHSILTLSALLVFAAAPSAFAGAAHCGDQRTIGRDSGRTFETYVCADQAAIQSASFEASSEAHSAALQRLEKFDGECSAQGGTIRDDGQQVSTNPHYVQQRSCESRYFPSWNPQPICYVQSWCQIDAHVDVTHSCVCSN